MLIYYYDSQGNTNALNTDNVFSYHVVECETGSYASGGYNLVARGSNIEAILKHFAFKSDAQDCLRDLLENIMECEAANNHLRVGLKTCSIDEFPRRG